MQCMNERKRGGKSGTRFWLNQIYTQRLRDTEQGGQMPPSIFTVQFFCMKFFSLHFFNFASWLGVCECLLMFILFVITHMLLLCTVHGNTPNTHFWCRWMKKNRTGSSHIKKANEWEKKWAAISHAKHKVQNIQMENYIRKFNSALTSIHQIKFNAMLKWLFAANCSF